LKALKRVAKVTGLDRKGASLNLDGGFDARHNRKAIFHAGLMPNIKENQRNRKAPQRGRKRLVDAAMHAFRERVERTFAWEDKCKRLLRRFEHLQRRPYGMKLLAYTLINVRRFCAIENLQPLNWAQRGVQRDVRQQSGNAVRGWSQDSAFWQELWLTIW
jgi:hypothetical protein